MHKLCFQLPNIGRRFPGLLIVVGIALNSPLVAAEGDTRVIQVLLGDYQYKPGELQIVVDQPVVLQLVNTDMITPHNFTLEDPSDGLDVNVDILAGDTVEVHLMPLVPGRHTFYCSNKLLFMDSHREKGMEGTLIVVPE